MGRILSLPASSPTPPPEMNRCRRVPGRSSTVLARAVLAGLLGTAAGFACAAAAPASTASPAAASGVEAAAPAPAPARRLEAADGQAQCEAAVGRSIRQTRGKAIQGGISFAGDEKSARMDGGALEVQGTGRYSRNGTPVSFRYRCVVDENGKEPGVVIHEAEAHGAAALPVWQPDLSRLSPAACEGAAATSLQSRYPRATGIVFDSGSRKLDPAGDGGTALSGRGQYVRSPGLAAGPFRYRCVFDAGGQLVETKAD